MGVTASAELEWRGRAQLDRRTNRFVIFALLGPPLGMITGLWIMLPFFNLAIGARPPSMN
jgi:hypothetical protein